MAKKDKPEDIANAMNTIRTRRGLTQAKAAALVGMSRSLWSALENKQRPLTVATLNRIELALECSEDEVLYLRRWWGDAHSNLEAPTEELTETNNEAVEA